MSERILGIVNAQGEKKFEMGYTGFTSSKISGQEGAYKVKFDKSFSQTPVLLVSLVNSAQGMTCRTTPSASGFELYVTQELGNGPNPAKASFNFGAWSK